MVCFQYSSLAIATMAYLLVGNVAARPASPIDTREVLASKVVVRNPQGPQPTTVTYDVTSIANGEGAPFNLAAHGGAGVVLTHTESYEVGYTVELGANLGLDIDEIFSLGVSASISKSTSSGSQDSAQLPPCPAVAAGNDQWECSGIITPSVVVKEGVQHFSGTDSPFTITFPRTTKENILMFGINLCACPNYAGWGSPGAPARCPQDC